MRGNFFNDEQKQFKSDLINALLKTLGDGVMEFGKSNSKQHTNDLISSVLITFVREAFISLFEMNEIIDANVKASIIAQVFSFVIDGIIPPERPSGELH